MQAHRPAVYPDYRLPRRLCYRVDSQVLQVHDPVMMEQTLRELKDSVNYFSGRTGGQWAEAVLLASAGGAVLMRHN